MEETNHCLAFKSYDTFIDEIEDDGVGAKIGLHERFVKKIVAVVAAVVWCDIQLLSAERV